MTRQENCGVPGPKDPAGGRPLPAKSPGTESPSPQAEAPFGGLTETVQPQGWQSALPRPQYNSHKKLTIPGETWYEVYRVAPDTYALYEPGHFQEVISFLILGQKKALAWDTGMGIRPVRPVLEYLTPLPIIALNSHNHFDHVGGNREFPLVYGFEQEGSRQRAALGYPHAFLAPMMGPDSLSRQLPPGFDPETYAIGPWEFASLQEEKKRLLAPEDAKGHREPPERTGAFDGQSGVPDGDTGRGRSGDSSPFCLTGDDVPAGFPSSLAPYFLGLSLELGGRRLELLHTPGHTGDSIMLLDRSQGILFTGDTVYPAALYAHFDDSLYGRSSLDIYSKTMQDIQALAPFVRHLFCSHNFPDNSPQLLNRISEGFILLKNNGFSGIPDSEGNLRRDFDGFSIIFPAKNF
ncbi:MAG: MBL fold metallo-hydrolase [Peptococcaceae bacterium]|nr:MBL fold metallo-hydrolase [Peptococcaceae bacterium]